MAERREKIITNRTSRVVIALSAIVALGASLSAAPMSPAPRSVVAPTASEKATFRPLGDGPAIQIGRSFGRDDEDCITVGQTKGADGQVYVSRGMVCGR